MGKFGFERSLLNVEKRFLGRSKKGGKSKKQRLTMDNWMDGGDSLRFVNKMIKKRLVLFG